MKKNNTNFILSITVAILAILWCSYSKAGNLFCLSTASSAHCPPANMELAIASEPCLEITACLGSADLPLNLTNYLASGIPTDGIWISSGPDASALSGSTFNPSLAGTYVLTYSVSNGVCSNSESIVVIVFPPINADIEGFTVCQSPSGTINLGALLWPATTPGGVFTVQSSSTGVASITLSPSGTQLVYTIDLTSTPPYSITIRYTVTGADIGTTPPCATTFDEAIITISGVTESGFSLPDAWCATADGFNLAAYTQVLGGAWNLITPGAGSIVNEHYYPAANYTGLVQIDYQPPAGSCAWLATQFMQVYGAVSAALSVPETGFCLQYTDLPLDLSSFYLPSTTTSGTWQGTNITGALFNPDTTGIFQLVYYVANGVCTDTDYVQVAITNHEPPQLTALIAIGAIGNYIVPNQVCPTGELWLDADFSGGEPPFTYAWLGQGVTNPAAEQTTATVSATSGQQLVYSLLLTDAAGCIATQNTTVLVSDAEACFVTATQTLLPAALTAAQIYPNPAQNGHFTLHVTHLPSQTTTGQLMVYNLLGEIIWQQPVFVRDNTLNQSVSLPYYSTGLHIINLRFNNAVYTTKLFIR